MISLHLSLTHPIVVDEVKAVVDVKEDVCSAIIVTTMVILKQTVAIKLEYSPVPLMWPGSPP